MIKKYLFIIVVTALSAGIAGFSFSADENVSPVKKGWRKFLNKKDEVLSGAAKTQAAGKPKAAAVKKEKIPAAKPAKKASEEKLSREEMISDIMDVLENYSDDVIDKSPRLSVGKGADGKMEVKYKRDGLALALTAITDEELSNLHKQVMQAGSIANAERINNQLKQVQMINNLNRTGGRPEMPNVPRVPSVPQVPNVHGNYGRAPVPSTPSVPSAPPQSPNQRK